ncbi:MAG TPA: hypothetical protein VJH67_03855 [Candidatus Paceibacterota bacterium]
MIVRLVALAVLSSLCLVPVVAQARIDVVALDRANDKIAKKEFDSAVGLFVLIFTDFNPRDLETCNLVSAHAAIRWVENHAMRRPGEMAALGVTAQAAARVRRVFAGILARNIFEKLENGESVEGGRCSLPTFVTGSPTGSGFTDLTSFSKMISFLESLITRDKEVRDEIPEKGIRKLREKYLK